MAVAHTKGEIGHVGRLSFLGCIRDFHSHFCHVSTLIVECVRVAFVIFHLEIEC